MTTNTLPEAAPTATVPEWLATTTAVLISADTIERHLDRYADRYGVASLTLQLGRGETVACPGRTRLVTGPAVVRFQRYRDGSTDAELVGITVGQLLDEVAR